MSDLLIFLALVLCLPSLYLAGLTLAALFNRTGWQSRAPETFTPIIPIAVLIPAHDEECVIHKALRALRNTDYPKHLVQCFVIADNCSDATAEIARAAGATVLERNDLENPGKGQALDWALTTHHKRWTEFEVLTILDADTIADAQFLQEIAWAFHDSKTQAVQGYYGTANIEAGWRPALSEVAFAVSHHLRPLGRNALGSTAGLKGNGMAFRRSLLAETGWPAHSLVEDLEFTLLLLQRGIRVQYCPAARVAAEMVTRSEAATTQRVRWEAGRSQVLKEYGPRLFREFLETRRFANLETLSDLLFPPLALYVLPSAAAIVAFLLTGHLTAALIITLGLSIVPLQIGVALLHRRVPFQVWLALLSIPRFLLWKVTLYLNLSRFGATSEWVRTQREDEADDFRIQVTSPTEKNRYREAAFTNRPFRSITEQNWRGLSARRSMRWHKQIRRANRLKRWLDIIGATTALFFLSPLLLATALLIWIEDRGPIFFEQQRVGKGGKPFTMLKFRSMRIDAEQIRKELEEQNEHDVAVTFKIKKDPRITKVGRIIRKFSIDEMPQFLNVLQGDMALVGPRPALPSEVAIYEGMQLRRVSVKPGISCLWQVQGRSDIDFEGQVQLDLEYIQSESISKDILILLKTIPAVILARGAY